ncbi:sigma factor binding protein 1, chloroplastic-like [Momordica charantia]|uniref:Sigma factor binding protein 1, chloroplastic-like n=1 Tax=Momordica charantia TaxID=3673 RepID=A0A6J1CME4_MOMCH|nr:sigma factor binding protein 1, chloroplastic-like [Momordica charantia]
MEKPIKVKYISNPMMVKANSESEFREIVQRLTGQNSPDDAFESPAFGGEEELNHAFYPPPPSTAVSTDPKGYYGLVSGKVGELGEGCFRQDEMQGFSGFQASCVNTYW